MLGVTPWPVKELATIFVVARGLLLPRVEQRLGLFKIVVVGSVVTRGNILGKGPAVDMVLIMHMRRTITGVVRDDARALRQGAMRPDVVGQHQRMASIGVRIEGIDSFHLHDAGDKIEIRLAVLHHEVPRLVASHQPIVDAEAIRPQHFLDDVGHFLELKDPKVRAPRGMPQPRTQDSFICREIAVSTDVSELRHLTGKKPGTAPTHLGGQIHLDGHVLAQQRFRRDRGVVTEQSHTVFEQAGYLLAAFQRPEFQLLAQRAVCDEGAIRH